MYLLGSAWWRSQSPSEENNTNDNNNTKIIKLRRKRRRTLIAEVGVERRAGSASTWVQIAALAADPRTNRIPLELEDNNESARICSVALIGSAMAMTY